ncbi:MAG: hypothetical protein U0Q16_36945 [Bryobacteraceae bacterium]
MKITRDVVEDLLPLYVAGEASAGSRALVDEYLATDAELREQVKRGDWGMELDVKRMTPGANVEVRALEKTRSLLAWQRRLFGLGLAATLLPFSSMFWMEGGHVHHRFLLAGVPGLMSGLLSVAFWIWLAYWLVRRKVRTAV